MHEGKRWRWIGIDKARVKVSSVYGEVAMRI